MTDAEYQAAKDRIRPAFEKWIERLGLRWWTVHYEWEREGIHGKALDGSDGVVRVPAQARVRWEYLDVRFQLDVPELAGYSDDSLEQVAVHECMHVFVNELRTVTDDWIKHEERVCSTLTSAFLWARDAILKEAKENQDAEGNEQADVVEGNVSQDAAEGHVPDEGQGNAGGDAQEDADGANDA